MEGFTDLFWMVAAVCNPEVYCWRLSGWHQASSRSVHPVRDVTHAFKAIFNDSLKIMSDNGAAMFSPALFLVCHHMLPMVLIPTGAYILKH